MAQAPTVQSLDQIMAELSPGYEGQKNVITQQIGQLGERYEADRLAMDAQKTKSFNQINTQAASRGMAFSGIPLDEQADYLSTHYLPGLQSLARKKEDDALTLQGQLASMDTDVRNRAFSSREQQVSSLNSWNQMMQQLEASEREAEKQRAFQAEQDAKNKAFQAEQGAIDRNFQASQNAANRAAQSASASQSNKLSGYQLTLAMVQDATEANGGRFMTTTAAAQIAQNAINQGWMTLAEFKKNFSSYMNTNVKGREKDYNDKFVAFGIV